MSEARTRPTAEDVTAFIDRVAHPTRRADAHRLDEIFRAVTGWAPQMWGPTIIGYGSYHYRYETGHEGDMCATGFSPRKANQVIYIMPGYADFDAPLSRLGKHRLGKSCLYINKLADIDEEVLKELIRAGLDDLGRKYPVAGS